MCGILGQVNRQQPIDRELFAKSLAQLEKRGPDQSGCFFEPQLAFGHRRLAILDRSLAGKQPMLTNNRKLVIVFNGEIYNYQDLKKTLSPYYDWRTETDTEVLLQVFVERGVQIFKHIEGMFALAIYDQKQQLVTLARDHFGKKPLYYYLDEEFFCFASEMKALICNPQIRAKLKLDELSLLKYLSYGYVPSPHSFFDKIKKLEPATAIQFDICNWRIQKKYSFWQLENIQLIQPVSQDQIISKTEELLKAAVKKRLASDVPVGVFLSGGLDSSLLAHYLRQIAPQLESFTLHYPDYPQVDEANWAQQVARRLGLKNNLVSLERRLIKNTFLSVLDYLDEPLADAAIFPLHFLSQVAREKITVALSGDGADEIFGGYPKYQAQKFLQKYQFLHFLARLARSIIPANSQYFKLLSGCDWTFSQRQFIFGSGSFLPTELAQLVCFPELDLTRIFEEAQTYENQFLQKDLINRSLFLDCKIQLPDGYLAKCDQASMSASLELRNPFLDKKLAEFMFSLGGDWKVRGWQQKYLLKQLAEKHLGKKLVNRTKKGFGVPLGQWIGRELKELFEEYLFNENPFFNQTYIRKIFQEHLSGQADQQFKLLRIVLFNYWCQRYKI